MKRYLEILKLVWPLALGMVNNAVMQFVDRAFLAKESLASIEAVLPACTLAWVFMGFFQSVVSYSGVFVSQYHGSGEEGKCRESYRAGLFIALFSGVVSLALIPVGGWIFSATAASSAIAAKESVYYDIVILGSVFLYAQMASIAYFTGHGRTRVVFWVNLLGNVLNIALDPLLIFGWGMGIAGAAYATVFSQLVQLAVLLWLSRRELGFRHREPSVLARPASVSPAMLWQILRFGIPAGGYEILNMASFTIFVFVTGTVGELDFAVSNACFTINYLLFAPMIGFGIGAQTLVGQAIGRGDTAAAESDFGKTLGLGLGFIALVSLLVLCFSRPILSLFISEGVPQEAFYSLGFKLMTVMFAYLLFDGLDVIVSGALKGAGDTKFVFVWMFASAFVIWMPLVFLVKHLGGSIVELWYTMIAYVLVISAGSYVRWLLGRWKHIRIRA